MKVKKVRGMCSPSHFKRNKEMFFVEKTLKGSAFQRQGKYITTSSDFIDSDNLEVSIIGIKNVVDRRIPLPRKLLWITSLMSCCGLVAYYVSSRVILMISGPTQVAVTLKQNESLQLPDITLCPNTPFIPSKLVEMGMTGDGLPGSSFSLNGTFNVTQLWIDLAPSIKFISGSSVNYVNTMGSWEQTFTTMGVCYCHRYDEDVKASGLSFGMSVRINWSNIYYSKALNDLEGIKVFFHERRDEPLTELEGIYVTPGEDLSVAIRIKEFKSLNRKEHPCIEKPDYSRSRCVNNCFQTELYKLTKCRLPFMQKTELNESWCEPASMYTGAFRTFWRKAKGNLTLWAECGRSCLIECQKLIYTPYIESVAVSSTGGGVSIGKFTIYFPEMWYEIVEQKESYDLIAFLCDVGGTFGLFLGCSVLTLVELVEIFATFIAQKHTTPTTSLTTEPSVNDRF